jgi:uncharacterized membrane protein
MGISGLELRRVLVAAITGAAVALMVSFFVKVELAILCGWDATALTFLVLVWAVIASADSGRTQELATREDLSRDTSRLLLLVASSASVVAVGLAIGRARQLSGAERWTLVAIAAVTVVLSWTVVNTVFLLRYAYLHYNAPPGAIDFAGADPPERPDYRDFAYLALTIGMCYQVSDTALGDPRIRRTALAHATVSYVFGVVIVAGSVNLISGLIRCTPGHPPAPTGCPGQGPAGQRPCPEHRLTWSWMTNTSATWSSLSNLPRVLMVNLQDCLPCMVLQLLLGA